ncbi:kinase-like protein [Myriangium duriaei CBS 260.36]|uniref:Kinase-like protein n=1 Tax=Myriangium duriaei CBS 260.36 TaxID=1168546 RepID=A0A9P4J9N6_9PEZI|nr:kinase-like protein [Myriangium duriaei CBS 260.36]
MASTMSGKQRPAPLQITESGAAQSSKDVVASGYNAQASHTTTSPPTEYDAAMSPPSTPPTRSAHGSFSQLPPKTPTLRPIAGDITFELDGAELLGSGLWSNVYKTEIAIPEPVSLPPAANELMTPPTTPQKSRSNNQSHIYAVKTASRPDAKEVFEEEARLLSYISLDTRSSKYVIPFLGLFNSSTSIVFHCASTTLSSFSLTFNDLASLPTLLQNYTTISTQLISGLSFLHSLHVIHADIKPTNILLDFLPSGPLARYCDFSASTLCPLSPSSPLLLLDPTLPDSPASSAPVSRANSQRKSPAVGGGTWSFMAPEQLASNPLINEPSYSSDVYALGITLLTLLLAGASPFREVEEQNIFLLREAIKCGNPMSFVKNDVGLRPRLKAIEATEEGKRALEGVGLACKKKKVERTTAVGWVAWTEAV